MNSAWNEKDLTWRSIYSYWVADPLTKTRNNAREVEHLKRAFEHFCAKTEHLEQAYSALQKKFNGVNVELEKSNEQLNEKVEQLNNTSAYLQSILGNMTQGLLFVSVDGTTVGISILSLMLQDIINVKKDIFVILQVFQLVTMVMSMDWSRSLWRFAVLKNQISSLIKLIVLINTF